MSWDALAYVKKLKVLPDGSPITKSEKLLLFVLADYHHDERRDAWASLRHLAEESLCTRRSVVRNLSNLERKGVIRIITSPAATTKRIVNRYQFVAIDPVKEAIPPVRLGTSGPQTRDTMTLGLGTSGPHIFPKNLSNVSIQKKERASARVEPPTTLDEEPDPIRIQAYAILTYLNERARKRFLPCNPLGHPTWNILHIEARLREGYTEGQCREVIDRKTAQWFGKQDEHGRPFDPFLRPSTLFGVSKFSGYLGETICNTGTQENRTRASPAGPVSREPLKPEQGISMREALAGRDDLMQTLERVMPSLRSEACHSP